MLYMNEAHLLLIHNNYKVIFNNEADVDSLLVPAYKH